MSRPERLVARLLGREVRVVHVGGQHGVQAAGDRAELVRALEERVRLARARTPSRRGRRRRSAAARRASPPCARRRARTSPPARRCSRSRASAGSAASRARGCRRAAAGGRPSAPARRRGRSSSWTARRPSARTAASAPGAGSAPVQWKCTGPPGRARSAISRDERRRPSASRSSPRDEQLVEVVDAGVEARLDERELRSPLQRHRRRARRSAVRSAALAPNQRCSRIHAPRSSATRASSSCLSRNQ